MSKVIHIPTESEASALWQVYQEKSRKAQQTLDIKDGFEAGKAWKNFLDIFNKQPERGSNASL